MPLRLAFTIPLAVLLPCLAHATLLVSVTGTTAGAPTFQRPVEDLSALSVIGTAVDYDVLSFTPAADGVYTFLTSGEFDTFAILYGSPFVPTKGLANALIANDDIGADFNVSGFSFSLTGGSAYSYIVTGFDNDEAGNFSTTIKGPPLVSDVTEPASVLLFDGGLVALALSASRGRRRIDLARGEPAARP